MEPAVFLREMIDPGIELLALLSSGRPSVSDNARRMLLAIAQQESGPNLDARYQSSPAAAPGPARGWWQFEQGGGVAGVLSHTNSRDLANKVCQALTVVNISSAVWRALEGNDRLACCFARLLLWTDPAPLPTTQQDGWNCYTWLWRPGSPHPDVWPGNWQVASTTVGIPA